MNFRSLLKPARLLAIVDIACCVVLLVLLLMDAIWPLRNLFLQRSTKVFVLVTCLLTALCGGIVVARRRAAMRRAAAQRRRR